MTEAQNANNMKHQQSRMARGVAWLTTGNFISRLLGVIYVIPWYAWLGVYAKQANALFGMGYNVYANFLLISTVGIPVAVAKQIAKYNSLGKEETSYYLVKQFLKLMLILGAVFAAIMYLASPWLAKLSGAETELLPVMRSLSWAVLLFPSMSVLRGTFQGRNNLKPYAISQIIEQVLRIVWILAVTFYIMKVGSGNYLEAVIQSTFAAFIGMIGSLAFLLYTLYREGALQKIWSSRPTDIETDTVGLIIETTKEAIPFIIIGSAVQLYQFIDQGSFVNAMKFFTGQTKDELLVLYSYMVSNPSKITMILIAVAGSVASVSIPLITERFVLKDNRSTAGLIISSLQMLLMFLIPAVFGSVILAKPLYFFFYGKPSTIETSLFIVNLLQVFILGTYTVLGPIIQALFENRRAMWYFFYGLLVKLVLQVPFIYLFHAYGPLLSTTIGLSFSIYLMYKRIHALTHFNRKVIYKNTLLVLLMTAVMVVAVGLVEFVLATLVPTTSRLTSVLHLLIAGGTGILVYGYLALITKQADKLIGQTRADALRRRLHI